MASFPHLIHTDTQVFGNISLQNGAKLAHWPYVVVRANFQLERDHRGFLILAIANAPIVITMPELTDDLDQGVFRIRHFGGSESVTIRGEGATKLDNDLDSVQIAPGGWFDCVAIGDMSTWALTGNDRVITEGVFFVDDNQTVTAVPGGFYNIGPINANATLVLPAAADVPGAFIYAYVIEAKSTARAIIQTTGRDRIDGRRHNASYESTPEYSFTGGQGWAITLRSDGGRFWVIV